MVLRIERIVAGGDGLARHEDGRAVFVARTAPGDCAEVEYTEEHRQWLRARLVRLVEPSPHRREPQCPYYDACGGCQLQHMAYDAQLSAKALIVADSLRRLGGLDVGVPSIVPSPRELGYRNRITLVLRNGPGGPVIGYHSLEDPSVLVEIARCPLAENPINEALAAVGPLLERVGRGLPRGTEWRLTFRADSAGRVGLAIEGAKRPGEASRTVVEELARNGLAAVWLVSDEGRIVARAGEETLAERFGSHEIPLAGLAFLQVNREAAARLEACVLERCDVSPGTRVLDAYCGFGLRTLAIAEKGARVVGIDSDRLAIRTAREIAAATACAARFVADRVERVIAQELPADLVVVNPPRTGVAQEVTDALVRMPPERLVYVSCDPATLARDSKRVSAVLALESVEAFDLFPQTAHVESVATLVSRAAGLANGARRAFEDAARRRRAAG